MYVLCLAELIKSLLGVCYIGHFVLNMSLMLGAWYVRPGKHSMNTVSLELPR